MEPFSYYVRTEGEEVSKKANKGEQGEVEVVRPERSHFKRFQRRIIAAIT